MSRKVKYLGQVILCILHFTEIPPQPQAKIPHLGERRGDDGSID